MITDPSREKLAVCISGVTARDASRITTRVFKSDDCAALKMAATARTGTVTINEVSGAIRNRLRSIFFDTAVEMRPAARLQPANCMRKQRGRLPRMDFMPPRAAGAGR